MASLGTSSQSTRARISLNSFLCYTGNLVNVAVHFLEAIFNEGVYTWVLKIVTDGQTDSLTNLIKCVVVYRSYSYALSLWAPGYRKPPKLDYCFITSTSVVPVSVSIQIRHRWTEE